jgi:hypothetical protein
MISLNNGDHLPNDHRVTIIARLVGDIVCPVDNPFEMSIKDYLIEKAGNDDGGSCLGNAEQIEEIIKNNESKLWDQLAAEVAESTIESENHYDDEEDDRKLPGIAMPPLSHHNPPPPMPPPLLQHSLIAVAPTFGPDPPQFDGGQHKKKRKKLLVAEAIVLVAQMATMAERARNSYERSRTRCALRDTLTERHTSLISTEFIMVFRMSPTAMEQLRHELYPFLRPNLSEANILGRRNSNRRPLSVDEKVMIGLMVAGGCPISGIVWGLVWAIHVQSPLHLTFSKPLSKAISGPSSFHLLPTTSKFWPMLSCQRGQTFSTSLVMLQV